MRDVLGDGVLAADGAGVDAVALASFAHGIVAAVEVLAVFEMLGEVVAAAGELAIQAEKPLLLGGEGLLRVGRGCQWKDEPEEGPVERDCGDDEKGAG